MAGNLQSLRQHIIIQIKDIAHGVSTEDIDRTVRLGDIGLVELYDVLTVHRVRDMCGMSCRNCEKAKRCAGAPALRDFLRAAGVVNTDTLKNQPTYKAGEWD